MLMLVDSSRKVVMIAVSTIAMIVRHDALDRSDDSTTAWIPMMEAEAWSIVVDFLQ